MTSSFPLVKSNTHKAAILSVLSSGQWLLRDDLTVVVQSRRACEPEAIKKELQALGRLGLVESRPAKGRAGINHNQYEYRLVPMPLLVRAVNAAIDAAVHKYRIYASREYADVLNIDPAAFGK